MTKKEVADLAFEQDICRAKCNVEEGGQRFALGLERSARKIIPVRF